MKKKSISAAEFDDKINEGQDVTSHLDLTKVQKTGLEPYRVNVDFPLWMVQKLDSIAKRLGVTRQSVIKIYISEKLKDESV